MWLYSAEGSSFSTDIDIVLEKVFVANANGMTTDRCEMNEFYFILKKMHSPGRFHMESTGHMNEHPQVVENDILNMID